MTPPRTALRLLCALALAFVAAAAGGPAGCQKKPTGSSSSGDPLCDAGAFVFCLCSDQSSGTKQCNAAGSGFGECGSCEGDGAGGSGGPSMCAAGTAAACSCANGASGTYVCDADGSGFGPCDCGGAGGSGGSASADQCPGEPVGVDTAGAVVVVGDTSHGGSGPQGSGVCATPSPSGALVYQVMPSVDGKLTAKVTPKSGSFDPVLFVRTGDCRSGAQTACADANGKGAGESTSLSVKGGAPLFFVVTGDSGTVGPFQLTLTLSAAGPAASCGDGHVDAGEQCDDGAKNGASGDGCSKTCTKVCGDGAIEPNETCDDGNKNGASGDGCAADCTIAASPSSAVAACPGVEVNLYDKPLVLKDTTVGRQSKESGSCSPTTSMSPEVVYHVTFRHSGMLHATITDASFDNVLYARDGMCDGGSEAGCSDDVLMAGAGEELDGPVATGDSLWLFVDGYNGTSGTYTLLLQVE